MIIPKIPFNDHASFSIIKILPLQKPFLLVLPILSILIKIIRVILKYSFLWRSWLWFLTGFLRFWGWVLEGLKLGSYNFGLDSCNFGLDSCNFALHSCNFGTYSCNFDTHSCNFDTHSCNFGTYSCNFGVYSCYFGTHSCNFGMYSCNFGSYSCNFGSYSCNFALHSCNFGSHSYNYLVTIFATLNLHNDQKSLSYFSF